MLTVTYVITIYNREKNIGNVIESIKNERGSFRKELVIIDNGSTDNSLNIVRNKTIDLPNVTIVTQVNQEVAAAVNKGITLAQGDFIHFIDGNYLLDKNATIGLLNVCLRHKVDVAYGLYGDLIKEALVSNKYSNNTAVLINNPINVILKDIQYTKNISFSTALVTRSILCKILEAGAYDGDLSMSLRYGVHSNFVLLKDTVCYAFKKEDILSSQQQTQNILRVLFNFMNQFEQQASGHLQELHQVLFFTLWKFKKSLGLLFKYLRIKHFKCNMSFVELRKLYKTHLDALER